MRRTLIAAVLAAALAAASAPVGAQPFGRAETIPPTVPVGFAVTPAGLAPGATGLVFHDDALYVSSLLGIVFRLPVVAGVVAGPPTIFMSGLTQPLGIAVTDSGVFVSDLVIGGARDTGTVLRARDTDGDGSADVVETVIAGLPNGRHNTNNLAIGPDGLLYITNGNSTDSGFGSEGGPPEVQPYSGSLLRVDPSATNLSPAPEMVVGTGWRNIYDVAFVPAGHPANPDGRLIAAVPMNGPDGVTYNGVRRPTGEDTLSILDVGDGVVEHFGFPWCLYDRDRGGLAGFTQDPSRGSCHPLTLLAYRGLTGPAVQAFPSALFGDHVSSNGIAFNPGTNFPDAYDGDAFVADFGSFFDLLTPRGHKVVRVRFDASGAATAVEDFMTSVTPLDLTFAPDGALWVADISGAIVRVAAVS